MGAAWVYLESSLAITDGWEGSEGIHLNTKFGGLKEKRAFSEATEEAPVVGLGPSGSFAAGLEGEGSGGFWVVLPRDQGGAGQNCAQSHQGLCHEGWSNPSAQPRTEVWRREVKGGGAPCMEEGTVKRELRFTFPAPGDHFYSFGPFCWEG